MAAVTPSDYGVVKVKGFSVDAKEITVNVGENLIAYPGMSIHHRYRLQLPEEPGVYTYSRAHVFTGQFAYIEIERKVMQVAVRIFDQNRQLLKTVDKVLEEEDRIKLSFWNQRHSIELNIEVPDEETRDDAKKILIDYVDQKITIRTISDSNDLENSK